MKVKILNFADKEAIIDIENIHFPIHVEVVSGDEILTINGEVYDSAELLDNRRTISYYDEEYDVEADEFDKWMGRIDSYDYNRNIDV